MMQKRGRPAPIRPPPPSLPPLQVTIKPPGAGPTRAERRASADTGVATVAASAVVDVEAQTVQTVAVDGDVTAAAPKPKPAGKANKKKKGGSKKK